MLRLTPGSDVKICLGMRNALRLYNGLGVVCGQLLERRENILANERALLHPAVGPVRHAHVDEAPVVGALQNLQAVAILNRSDFVVDSGHTVTQERLRRRNVRDLVRPAAVVLAGGKREHERKGECVFTRKSQHGVVDSFVQSYPRNQQESVVGVVQPQIKGTPV